MQCVYLQTPFPPLRIAKFCPSGAFFHCKPTNDNIDTTIEDEGLVHNHWREMMKNNAWNNTISKCKCLSSASYLSYCIAQVFGVRKQGIKGIFRFFAFSMIKPFISGIHRQFAGGVFPFDSSTIDNSDDDEDDTEVLFICLRLYVCVQVVCEWNHVFTYFSVFNDDVVWTRITTL